MTSYITSLAYDFSDFSSHLIFFLFNNFFRDKIFSPICCLIMLHIWDKKWPAKIGNPVKINLRFMTKPKPSQREFFNNKRKSHFLGTTLVTSSPLVISLKIYVTNNVIAHVLLVGWSQIIIFEKCSPMPWFWYIGCPDC